jgi:hypothetical protein
MHTATAGLSEIRNIPLVNDSFRNHLYGDTITIQIQNIFSDAPIGYPLSEVLQPAREQYRNNCFFFISLAMTGKCMKIHTDSSKTAVARTNI